MNDKRIAALLALVFGALYSLGIAWGMPSEFVSEIDSEFPSGPFNILAHLRDSGFTSNYPVFHKLLLLPLYTAIILMFKITGHLSSFESTWPYGFDDPAAAMTAMIIAARIISLIMGTGTIYVLGLLVSRKTENTGIKNRLLVFSPVLAFGLSGVFAYYSRVSNYDVPQLFWWSLSFFFLWRFFSEAAARRKDLVLSALFGALAVATKDQTVFFIAGSSLLLFFLPSSEKMSARRVRHFVVYSLSAVGFYALAAVSIQPLHWISHMKQVLFLNITSGQFAVFPGTLSGQAGLLLEVCRCLSHVISPLGIVIGAAGLLILVMKRKWAALAFIGLPIVITYFFIFARIHFAFERYLLNYAFLFTLAASGGIRYSLESFSPRMTRYVRPALYTLTGCWILYQLVFSFVPLTYAQVHDTKKQLASLLPRFVPPGDTISWQGARFSLPNASVYTKHRFAVPDSVYGSLHSSRMAHVFVRSGEQRAWVLSDRDLFLKESGFPAVTRRNWIDTSGLTLAAKVEAPLFVRDNIRVYTAAHRAMTFRVSVPYYLYKRN
jgi:hypothetical protein